MKIRTRLILILLVSCLMPVLIIGIIVFIDSQRSIKAEKFSDINVIADLKVDKIRTFFNEKSADIQTRQSSVNIQTNLPIIIKYKKDKTNSLYIKAKNTLDITLQSYQQIMGYINVSLVDSDGMVVYVSNPSHMNDLDKILPDPDHDAFEKGKEGVYFSEIFKNHLNENSFEMLMAAPLFDDQGKFIGIIAVEMNMDPLYQFIQDTTGLGETGETLIATKITNLEGSRYGQITQFTGEQVLYLNPLRHDQSAALKKSILIGSSSGLPIQDAVSGNSGSGVSIDYRGRNVLAAWRFIPELNWGLVAKIDTNEAYLSIYNLFYVLAIVLAFSVSAVIFLAVWISYSFTNPIKHLAESASRLARGDFEINVSDIVGKDEIGSLARDCENLAKALTRNEKEQYEFISSASHQIRTPASGVQMALGELIEKLKTTKNQEDLVKEVETICNNNARLIAIINDLFLYLELGENYKADNLEKVNLTNFLDEIIQSFDEQVKDKGMEISQTVDKGLTVMADGERLQKALLNILDNAVLYSNEKGKIQINAIQKDDAVEISIKDNGIGIPKSQQINTFDKFFRAKNAYLKESVGTGLGLTIAKIIVEGHGGKIWFESEEEKGTTFYISLPKQNGAV